jgi:hypothetical protein
MIGGTDIVCELRVDEQDADFVVRFFAAAWPHAQKLVVRRMSKASIAHFQRIW